MGNIKVSELTEKTAPHKDDLFVIADMENDLSKCVKFGTVKPYKSFTFIISQATIAAPVVTVLVNELGGTPVWTRSAAGQYVATLAGAFPVNKTVCPQHLQSFYNGADGFSIIEAARDTDNTFNIITREATGEFSATDTLLNALPLEIRVYN